MDKIDLLCDPACTSSLFTYQQVGAGNLSMYDYVVRLKNAVFTARNSIAHFHWYLPLYRGHRALHYDLDAAFQF